MDKKWFQQVLVEKVNILLTGRKEDDVFFEDSRDLVLTKFSCRV